MTGFEQTTIDLAYQPEAITDPAPPANKIVLKKACGTDCEICYPKFDSVADAYPANAYTVNASSSTSSTWTFAIDNDPWEVQVPASWNKAKPGASPAAPQPAPEPVAAPVSKPKRPVPKRVTVAGIEITAKRLRGAISRLKRSTGTEVFRHLAKDRLPIDTDILNALISQERAWNPQACGTLKTAAVAALRRLIDPNQVGPFTLDGDGYCQWTAPSAGASAELIGLEPAARIKEIAKAFGNGRVIGRGFSAMSHDQQINWLKHWYSGRLGECYKLETAYSLKPSAHHPGAPQHSATHQVQWAPAVPGEVPAGVQIPGDWSSPYTTWSSGETNNYLVAARMAHPRYLSSTARRRWVANHLRGCKAEVDEVSLRALRSAMNSAWTDHSQPAVTIQPAKPGFQDLVAGGVNVQNWSTGAVAGYAAEHQLDLPGDILQRYGAVTAHFQQVAQQKAIDAAKLTFTLAPAQPELSGFHRKAILVDQHGRRWVFKPAPNDGAAFRPETEHEAHQLARAWGYRTAESHLITFDGKYGQVQAMLAADRNLLTVTGTGFAELTRRQLCAIAREHVLDWAIDNDDCHGENIIISEDDEAIGIDKGRAWRYLGGWSGLTGDATADTNCKLVYTKLYAAIAAGHLDRDTVDAMYRSVLTQARRMQLLPDEILAGHLGRAVANRPHYQPSSYQSPVPDAPGSAEELIAAAIKRKHALADDFTTLWADVYARAGWTPPEPIPVLETNQQGHPLHTGLHDPTLHSAVMASKSYGTATFLAGTDVEDAHLLLWRERDSAGTCRVRGQVKLRHTGSGCGYVALGKWCADRTDAKANAPIIPTSLGAEVDGLYQAIIQGAKTISYHSEDGGYNQSKLDSLSYARTRLETILAARTAALAAAPDHPMHPKYIEMATLYLGYVARIEAHKKERTKSQEGDFPRYGYVAATAPAPAVPVDPVKVTRIAAYRDAATLADKPQFDPDGELRLSGAVLKAGADNHFGQIGELYQITLPTGERIEFRNKTTGAAASQDGLLEFTVADTAHLADGLARIDAALTEAGVRLEPADALDLELFYWRHLTGIMGSRADSRPGTWPMTFDKSAFWQQAKTVDPTADRDVQLTKLRAAFACLTNAEQVDSFIASGAHLPRFLHLDLRNPTLPCGKPHWLRFDVTAAQWRTKKMPTITYRTGVHGPVTVGAGLSTEARLRTLAIWKDGMSSAQDMIRGSGDFVFARQNQEAGGQRPNVYLSPKVLARTSTYTFPDDRYGAITERASYAAFDFDQATGHTGSSNEALIKTAVSLLDDIEILTFDNGRSREVAIAQLAALGIDTIRGVPVATRFIVKRDTAAYQAAVEAARASYHQDWP